LDFPAVGWFILERKSDIHFYGVGDGVGFARGTGVCFSTWLAVAHSASFAGLFL
jgi:hypothetical protein